MLLRVKDDVNVWNAALMEQQKMWSKNVEKMWRYRKPASGVVQFGFPSEWEG